MLEAIVLLPTVVAIAMLFFASPQRVLLRVYLPCLMLVPLYIQFQVRGVNVDPASLVGMVLAIAGLVTQFKTLRLTALDLCMVALLFSIFYADAHHGRANIGGIAMISALLGIVFPYIIGRTLIEQTGSRTQFAKLLVICLFGVAIISVWEFRMTVDLFQSSAEAILGHASGLVRQRRWGFGRVAGPYCFAITAGMMFTFGVMFQLWLAGKKLWQTHARRAVLSRPRPYWVLAIVLLGLFMTGSRGPWIGCGLGLILALIGLAKNRKRAMLIGFCSFVFITAATLFILDRYSDANADVRDDQDRQNATYRRKLLDTYAPIVDAGGLWGNGSPTQLYGNVYGYDMKQASIDNEFLFVAVDQGYFGAGLLVVCFCLSIFHLVLHCYRLKRSEDFAFAFCMLGLIVGSAFSLTTVFMCPPTLQLIYLCFGWSQSIRPSRASAPAQVAAASTPYVFERVFV
jgi:hypothetical protein